MNIPIYYLSYNNPTRATRMENRFKSLGLDDVTVSPGVKDDNRANSMMLGQMDMLRRFCDRDDAEYAVFCEDDIYIHKDLKKDLPSLVEGCKKSNRDILLMGYLYPDDVSLIRNPGYGNFPHLHKGENCDFYGYPEHIWGAQMYMLSKKKAREFLELKGPFDCPADWNLTKFGNRALTVPLYAVEDGTTKYSDGGQDNLHWETFRKNISNQYI